MVSHVTKGLPELLRDFGEGTPLKKMQLQRLPLVFRQFLYNLSPSIPSEKTFQCTVIFLPFRRLSSGPIKLAAGHRKLVKSVRL